VHPICNVIGDAGGAVHLSVTMQEVLAVKKALLTVEEAAMALDIPPPQLNEMLARGEMPVVRIGSAVRIPTAAVQRWRADRAGGSHSTDTAAERDGGVTRT